MGLGGKEFYFSDETTGSAWVLRVESFLPRVDSLRKGEGFSLEKAKWRKGMEAGFTVPLRLGDSIAVESGGERLGFKLIDVLPVEDSIRVELILPFKPAEVMLLAPGLGLRVGSNMLHWSARNEVEIYILADPIEPAPGQERLRVFYPVAPLTLRKYVDREIDLTNWFYRPRDTDAVWIARERARIREEEKMK